MKVKRTYYTKEKLNNMNSNIDKYEWAKKSREKVLRRADEYLNFGLENILCYVTGQNLPRSYGVNQMKGCPVCGKNIDKFGNYPYKADIFNEPFKIKCPSCKSVFPSNDFDSYYKSGLDENGLFSYEKADPKYLINELYPDKPSDWCVDDGFGWIDPEGIKKKSYSKVYDQKKGVVLKDTTKGDNRYTFIAYYNHWFIWVSGFGNKNDDSMVTSAVRYLSFAYLLTGEAGYKNAGVAILNRIADFYPEYDAGVYKWEDNFRHSGGAFGKIVGSIWEESVVDNFILAYDAFFPGINDESLQTIRNLPIYTNNPLKPSTADDIKENIEKNILYRMIPEVKLRRIRGNVGMHQATIAKAALVLDDEEYFDYSVDFILSTTDKEHWGPGNINRIIMDEVCHDGIGNETSVSYNSIWLNGINTIAQILKGTKRDLYKNPKFVKMFNLYTPFLIADKYSLNIGDTSCAGRPDTILHKEPLESMVEVFSDINAAKLLDLYLRVNDNGQKAGRKFEDLFGDIEGIENTVNAIVKKYGEFKSESRNYSGYGIAKFEFKDPDDKKSVWIYYGRNTGHGHRDTLMLGIFAHGMYLNPDHGYPCFADSNHERRCWTVNTISHDTVTVDNRPGNDHICGTPLHYLFNEKVSLADISAGDIYPQTECYRRTSTVINYNGYKYIADFFRIKGGSNHKYVFHGAYGQMEYDGINPVLRSEGTYAGKNVEFACVEYDDKHSDGFDYLYDVKTQKNVNTPFSVDWKPLDIWNVHSEKKDVHLKLTMVNSSDEVVLAKGKPPQNKPGNPEYFDYLIAERKTDESCFAAVIEPYENISPITGVVNAAGSSGYEFSAVKVTFNDNRVDYIINSIDDKEHIVDEIITFKGFFAVVSIKNNEILFWEAADAELLKFRDTCLLSENNTYRGIVTDFTKDNAAENFIRVKPYTAMDPGSIKEKYIHIKNDGIRNGVYEIVSCEEVESGIYELGTSDVTFIRKYKDPMNFEDGYEYNIDKGMEFYIPLFASEFVNE